MEKQYHVGSCMEASLSLEEYRNLEFPNLKKVKWTTSAEGDIRQIFFTPDTMITLTNSSSEGTLAKIKGNIDNIESSRQLWEKILGGKFEEIENGN